MPFFWAVVTFASSVAVAVLLMAALGSGQHYQVAARLRAIGRASQNLQDLGDSSLVKSDRLSDIDGLNRLLLRWKWPTKLQDYLLQAGLGIRPGKFSLTSGVLAGSVYLLALHFSSSPPVSAALALTTLCIPIAVVSIKRSSRMNRFEKGFPDAVDLLARVVRSGQPFAAGLEMVPRDASEPVAGEFRRVFEEYKLGLSQREALHRLARRVPLVDVRFFVTAVVIQRESGGNLGEILDNLSGVIRERFKIYGEVRTRSAQGRLTAALLIAMPLILIALLAFTNPTYLQPLFHQALGKRLLIAAALLQAVGSALLWKIVHIEV
ncbi:MAG TPA: type II secretion system F family protein [Terriglobia bacterium]|nr:type II secretion system F family protein [Terriglobia bacterium]